MGPHRLAPASASVSEYAGPLDVERLVRWVATVKLLSRIAILKGAQMMTATTQHEESTAGAADRLLMAIELGRRQWNVGFTTRLGHRIRRRTLPAAAWDRLPEEIAAAKKRLALPADASVTSCYEAGRGGFWVHRYLTGVGVENLVVDSSSLEVNRRARRAKTDVINVLTQNMTKI
jgi:hypothetical protein